MDKSLAVVEQRTVEFYGDKIVAVRAQDGTIFVPIRPICELLDVNFDAQRRRINRDAVLSEEVMSVVVTTTDIDPSSRRPNTSEMLAIPLDYVSGFLFGINASRVKEDVRDRLIRYQRECYKVLAEAFQEGRLTADPVLDDLLRSDSDAVQAYKMLQALVKLARNQILLESQLQTHSVQIADHDERLENIESTLGDTGRLVTPDQASQISQAVKAVAIALGKKSGRNEFGGVYGELYRKFGITGYKQLPAAKFQPAMAWLNEWRESVEGPLPF
jgi:ferritin-like metal-binding protein YciE